MLLLAALLPVKGCFAISNGIAAPHRFWQQPYCLRGLFYHIHSMAALQLVASSGICSTSAQETICVILEYVNFQINTIIRM